MPYVETLIRCGWCNGSNSVRIGGQTETPADASPIKLAVNNLHLYLQCKHCNAKVRLPYQKIEKEES